MSEYLQKTKLFEDLSNEMIEKIRSRQWSPGTRLPSEPELAELFGVSRATVRSAVRVLQLSGILRSKSGSGTFVSQQADLVLETRELASVMADPQSLRALIQTRYVLEPQLAALAAEQASDDEIARLFEILRDMEDHRDRHSLMSHGYRFHQAVAEFSHNQVLYGFCQSVSGQLRGLRVLDSLTLESFLAGISAHRAIAEAIADRNGALAKELMRAHLKKDYGAYLSEADLLD